MMAQVEFIQQPIMRFRKYGWFCAAVCILDFITLSFDIFSGRQMSTGVFGVGLRVLGIPLFYILSRWAFRQARGGEKILADDRGLSSPSILGGRMTIPWDNIAELDVGEIRFVKRHSVLFVKLKDRAAFRRDRRVSSPLVLAAGMPPYDLHIGLDAVPVDPRVVLDQVKVAWAHHCGVGTVTNA
ncbi:MAG: hypothetical protein AAF415_00185 [Pseudomonadota bacterium]